ncbi:protein of unknown function [Methylorubrum extorquens]|uniref:Uncharacterized protein n=1 Tax=Methylorubrum extorquens TaxID=408 RepID=A0A2N9AZD2_METEX|nr:protein of unknown function [Methylorubrum extorquens]
MRSSSVHDLRYLDGPYCFSDLAALRDQDIDLTQLGDGILAACLFRRIKTSSTLLKAIPQGGPLFRRQATETQTLNSANDRYPLSLLLQSIVRCSTCG